MICQFCETEYPADTERCAECGCYLVESLESAASEHVMEPLGDLTSRRQLEILVQLLEEARIPYFVTSGTALSMQDRQTMGSTVHRREWEARVTAVSSRLEDARSAWLAAAETAVGQDIEETDETEDGGDGRAGGSQDGGSSWNYPTKRFEPR